MTPLDDHTRKHTPVGMDNHNHSPILEAAVRWCCFISIQYVYVVVFCIMGVVTAITIVYQESER